MNPGTAYHRLRKMILWKYIKLAGDNTCFQCGEEIVIIDDLSVEHKIPWLDSKEPIRMFFDEENIAFSHLSCNIRASKRHRVHCENGHRFSGVDKRGFRICEICRRESRRKHRDRYPEEDTSAYRRKQGWRT